MDFESCKLKAWLKHGARIPDPNPSPAADRGTQIHTLAEDFVQGKIKELPHELRHFKDEFHSLRKSFKAGNVSLEGEWGFNKEWEPCDYKHAWVRIKLDACIHPEKTHAIVVDYKTGRKFGNEIKHGEQLQLYVLAVFLREPTVQVVTAELWYLDQNDLTSITVTREAALSRYLKLYDRRGQKLTGCTDFPANPNQFSCRWCPYKPTGTGHCKVGV